MDVSAVLRKPWRLVQSLSRVMSLLGPCRASQMWPRAFLGSLPPFGEENLGSSLDIVTSRLRQWASATLFQQDCFFNFIFLFVNLTQIQVI